MNVMSEIDIKALKGKTCFRAKPKLFIHSPQTGYGFDKFDRIRIVFKQGATLVDFEVQASDVLIAIENAKNWRKIY